jgi:8-oxo-dGTP pyrophosphatase MutT (NUDIX family)
LLHRRNPPNAGQWDGVGGKLEPGEDPFTGCIREVYEESGLRIEQPALRVLVVITVRSTGALWILFCFTASAPQMAVVASDEGELAWVEINRVQSMPVVPDVPIILSQALSADEVVVIRSEQETEEAGTATRMEVLGPASRATVIPVPSP